MLKKTIGYRIKKIRKTLNLTQGDLAGKIGVYTSDISLLETDKREMGIKTLRKLAEALKVSPGWLLTGEGSMETGGEQKAIGSKEENLSEQEAMYRLLSSSFDKILYQGEGERRRNIINEVMAYAEELEPKMKEKVWSLKKIIGG